VWQFEGNERYGELLHFALNKSTVETSLVLITLDFTRPWDFLDSLSKWTAILESSIASLKLPVATMDDLKEKSS